MHVLDNYIRDNFLKDIVQLFEKYNINSQKDHITTLLTRLIYSKNFDKDIYELYTKHYKRNLNILEALAAKENLEKERLVFNLTKHHINKDNIKLTITHLSNLYYSHIKKEVVNPPKIAFQGIII